MHYTSSICLSICPMPVPFIDHAIVPMYHLTAAAHHCQGSSIELSSAGLQQQAC